MSSFELSYVIFEETFLTETEKNILGKSDSLTRKESIKTCDKFSVTWTEFRVRICYTW